MFIVTSDADVKYEHHGNEYSAVTCGDYRPRQPSFRRLSDSAESKLEKRDQQRMAHHQRSIPKFEIRLAERVLNRAGRRCYRSEDRQPTVCDSIGAGDHVGDHQDPGDCQRLEVAAGVEWIARIANTYVASSKGISA